MDYQTPHPPAPIGFEMQGIQDSGPPTVGFEGLVGPAPADQPMYPGLPADQNGPTPTDPSVTDPSASDLNMHHIGFEGDKSPLLEEPPTSVAQEDDGMTEVKVAPADDGLEKKEAGPDQNTVHFSDHSRGRRRIDFVLAYRDKDKDDDKEDSHREYRATYQQHLIDEGLELELVDKAHSQDGKTHFVKVHAPWEVLTRLAELMSIKMPIKEYDASFDSSCWDKIPSPFDLPEGLIHDEPDYFTADFNREREKMFIIDDKETFFTPAQRSLMVNQLLMRTRYADDRQKFGIDRLLRHGVYTAAYPLHDGPYYSHHSILTHGPANDRNLLYETWARPGRWYYNQPLDQIRRYFGEKVGIYFTWLGFYTAMLIPASVVGLIVFIYGCATLFSNEPSNDVCNRQGAGSFVMCPLCDKRCSYWHLLDSCSYSRLTYLFDNPSTVFFAGFMAIWATCFLEFWKRKQAEIQYDWDVAGFELEERLRPDFEVQCKHKKLNPVTQLMEPFLPLYSKIPRLLTSIVVILFMVFCVLAAVFGVIMYRIIVVGLLYAAPYDTVRSNAKLTTTATAALINLIAIMVLNKLYERIAVWLTELERQRTDSDFEDSFTLKMFLFQFINYYASIIYIAFFKGRWVTGQKGG